VTVLDVEVNPLWSETVAAKSDAVDTCRRYDVAKLTAFQLSVGETEAFTSLSRGVVNVGADGRLTIVVKLLKDDQALTPPAFFAHTRQ
jgi:hypothetical protein